MPATPAQAPTLRIGARLLLLDRADRVLLIHAKDPDQPGHHWWELPGGGADSGEALVDTARRELAEETGILLRDIGPHLWDRETRFHYRGCEHHRRESVYLARVTDTTPTLRPKHTANEKAGLIERHWWTQPRTRRLPRQTPSPQPCGPARRRSGRRAPNNIPVWRERIRKDLRPYPAYCGPAPLLRSQSELWR
ncbi:MAG: NUDIX domain-containing protein [Actinobacteria bacterium]|nr:NUDIX domain-containing protein [Actinomycetota bacterium]